MRTTTGVVLASLRAWWKELVTVAAFTAVACAPAHGTLFLGVFCMALTGVGWALGFSHRHRPVWDVIRGMDGKLDRALADEPPAEVRRLHSV